ncbi:MAG: NFACT family protein [Armatimonadetes bacterium]|nr:NFACT family protein [Armatimonadota bacterium]
MSSRPKLIPFDSVCLASVVAEAQSFAPGKLQKIIQPDDHSIVLALYAGVENYLLITAHPDFARAHFIARRPQGPATPPGFCQILRKHLMNSRVEFIRQRGLDRILEIGFSTQTGNFILVTELMGRHSNIMLVDGGGKVVSALKWVSSKQSKRPVQANRPYEPPPFDDKPSLLEAKPDDSLKEFEGWSPFLGSLIESGLSLVEAQSRISKPEFEAHAIPGRGAYPLPLATLDNTALPRKSISVALEQAFIEREQLTTIHRAQSDLLAQLNRVLKARNVALEGLTEAIQAAKNAPQQQVEGELILAYQGQIKPGDKSLLAYDYEGNEITIKLDPAMTPVENAEKRFKKAKSAKARLQDVTEQRDRIQMDHDRLQDAIDRIQNATSPEEIDRVREEADKHRWLHHHVVATKKEERPYEGHAVRELLSPNGYKVIYGTNATSNDYVTNRVAKGNDWWFHVRGQNSAHVILITAGSKPETIQRADMEYAALVSARNSPQKHGSYVPVDYTLKKYVRKPRGSAPGLAVYEREKTIHVDP